MLKEGRAPSAVYAHLVQRGAEPNEANACLTELLALKTQAEAANPAKLRAAMARMLFYGATTKDVVAYCASLGVREEHAMPEIERIAASVRSMIVCQRCGQPVLPTDAFFDPSGNQICKICHSSHELGEAQRRVVAAELNEWNMGIAFGVAGVLLHSRQLAVRGFREAAAGRPSAGPTTCPRCRVSSGVRVEILPPHVRANLHPAVAYACQQCGAPIA
jgi:hypothetical protein